MDAVFDVGGDSAFHVAKVGGGGILASKYKCQPRGETRGATGRAFFVVHARPGSPPGPGRPGRHLIHSSCLGPVCAVIVRPVGTVHNGAQRVGLFSQ